MNIFIMDLIDNIVVLNEKKLIDNNSLKDCLSIGKILNYIIVKK